MRVSTGSDSDAGVSPTPALDQPVTIGCTEVAEEGNACTPPRSARPSLGLPAHETRATSRRCCNASTEVDAEALSRSPKPSREETVSGNPRQASWLAARRPHPSRGKSHHVAHNAKGIAVSVAMRGSKHTGVLVHRFQSCRSRQATTAGLIEASSPVNRPDRPQGRWEVNGGLVQGEETSLPSRNREWRRSQGRNRRREGERERGGCHPRFNLRPVWVQPPRKRERLSPRSRRGGRSYLGGAQAQPMRNGPGRSKASRAVEANTGHADVGESGLGSSHTGRIPRRRASSENRTGEKRQGRQRLVARVVRGTIRPELSDNPKGRATCRSGDSRVT